MICLEVIVKDGKFAVVETDDHKIMWDVCDTKEAAEAAKVQFDTHNTLMDKIETAVDNLIKDMAVAYQQPVNKIRRLVTEIYSIS